MIDKADRTIQFVYRNHNGKETTRNIVVDSIEYVAAPGFKYQPGWFISGYDIDKDARRSFALCNILLPGSTNNENVLGNINYKLFNLGMINPRIN